MTRLSNEAVTLIDDEAVTLLNEEAVTLLNDEAVTLWHINSTQLKMFHHLSFLHLATAKV